MGARRTIVVGDVHGCREELDALLEAVRFASGDRVVSVGDLVVRGPDPRGVVRRMRSIGAWAVRGNHEDRLLRFRASGEVSPRAVSAMTRKTAEALGPEDINWLAQLPYLLRLPSHGVVVVHAGVLPGVPLARQSPRVLMNIRSLGDRGEPVEERGRPSWAFRYPGPTEGDVPHIVFGHHALAEPQVHPHATGLDTGCVYGGRLTALVLEAGEPPPAAPEERRARLYQVPARRRWADP